MPFLEAKELTDHIPEEWATAILQKPNSFAMAERAAAQRVTAITGQAEPESATEAPTWTKQPMAFMILYARIGFLNPTAEQLDWAGRLNNQAFADLERHKLKRPSGRTEPVVEKLEGLNEF